MSKAKRSELVAGQARQALSMRADGFAYEAIAERLGVSVAIAHELADTGFRGLAPESAEAIRAQIELRLDDVLRRTYNDLMLAPPQVQRSALYRTILATEAQRARLLGVEIPRGTPDGDDDA